MKRRDTIVRYTAPERINHWITAFCFILAAVSGLGFLFPSFTDRSADIYSAMYYCRSWRAFCTRLSAWLCLPRSSSCFSVTGITT